MDRKEQKIKHNCIIVCLLVLVISISACVLVNYFNLNLIRINVPDYVQVSQNEDGQYQFILDKDRIRYKFSFSDVSFLPENIALDSLSLIVTPAGDVTYFEVGSTLENAGKMLNEGGYSLIDTVWSWNRKDISERYAFSLTVEKHISLKSYVHFHADGNYHWTPFIDYDLLCSSIGDRLNYDASLKNALLSLSVTSDQCTENSLKIETWSSFTSPAGISIESIFRSCGITILDTVFIIPEENILKENTRQLSLKKYCFCTAEETGIKVYIDKNTMLADLSFAKETAAAKAIDSLSVNTEEKNGQYYISAYSVADDIDIVTVLSKNGISLTDTCFSIVV